MNSIICEDTLEALDLRNTFIRKCLGPENFQPGPMLLPTGSDTASNRLRRPSANRIRRFFQPGSVFFPTRYGLSSNRIRLIPRHFSNRMRPRSCPFFQPGAMPSGPGFPQDNALTVSQHSPFQPDAILFSNRVRLTLLFHSDDTMTRSHGPDSH